MLIDWKDVQTAPGMRPGATRQAVAGERMSVVRVRTAPDAVFDGSLHCHSHEQILIMLEGELKISLDGRVFTARAGDLVFLPSGSLHGAVGVGIGGAFYYEIFSPPRYDQLPGYIGRSPLQYK